MVMNLLTKLSEIAALLVSLIIIGGFIGSIIWVLIMNRINRILKKYYTKEDIKIVYFDKDEAYKHFLSREKFDDILKPFIDKLQKVDSSISSLDKKFDAFMINFSKKP